MRLFLTLSKLELTIIMIYRLPSLNSTSFGSHFFLKFSINAGPNGAAPPVTALTESSMDDFTIGWVAKKLTNGGTRARYEG